MSKVFVIAEAGVNHNGDLGLARKLIDVAADAGADAVKFQTFKSGELVTASTSKADYQKASTGDDESQLEMLRKLELSQEDHADLWEYCKQKEILFLSSPFDLESIDFLIRLGLELIKIPSGEITNLPYLRKVGACGLPVIMSTGMAEMDEIANAIEILVDSGAPRDRITLLHCNSQYPTPFHDVNLRAMSTIQVTFGMPIGYSDHTPGIEVPVAAVALGASVIEKHFTLDREMEGPDHKASLDPQQLKEMVRCIRNVETALGVTDKAPTESERKNREIARKSIVAARPIARGEVFSEENLAVKRPGSGRSPMDWDDVIGTKAERDYQGDEEI